MSATTNRKTTKPVSGSVRVVRPIGAVTDNVGEIVINESAYYVQRHDNGYRLIGWNEKKAMSTMYDLPLDLSACSCPDATHRPEREGGCKHRAALVALRNAGKL